MDSPHDTKRRAANLIMGLLACDDLPQDDGPAEHVTLFTVVAPYRKQVEIRVLNTVYANAEAPALSE